MARAKAAMLVNLTVPAVAVKRSLFGMEAEGVSPQQPPPIGFSVSNKFHLDFRIMIVNKPFFWLILGSLFGQFLLTSCGNTASTDTAEDKASEQHDKSMMDGMHGDGMMGDSSMMGGGMMGHAQMMDDSMMQAMMSDPDMMKGMGPEMMKDMRTIHRLLMSHGKIKRRVNNLDNGVETWTESDDPKIAQAIQVHVRQMKERMEKGNPIRQMDPVFRELFDHHEKVNMQIKDTDKGIHVVETSEDPQVVLLIQQHANEAVSEFVKYGMKRAMKPTPLPEGYHE